VYDKYGVGDLFHAFLDSMKEAEGGILILPLIFFTAFRKSYAKVRDQFMYRFKISKVNYFETASFEDTTVTIVSFQFERSKLPMNEQTIEWNIYSPDKQTRTFVHRKNQRWLVGGYIFDLTLHPTICIKRHTYGKELGENEYLSNLTLRALDKPNGERIEMMYIEDKDHKFKKSPGAYHTFVFSKELSPEEQRHIASEFNDFLNKKREETHSLFMAMYRQGSRRRLCLTTAMLILSKVIS
jgi:hypothetical protein